MATETTAGAHTGGKRTRLTIDISPELRRRIRQAAAQRDVSVRAYVEKLLDQTVPAEARSAKTPTGEDVQQPITRDFLDGVLQFQEDWRRKRPGVVLDDTVEMIHQMRAERTEHLDQVARGE